jgi:hypothetical protein
MLIAQGSGKGIGDCRSVNWVMPSGTSILNRKKPANPPKGMTPPLAMMSSSVFTYVGKYAPGGGSN